MTDSWTAQDQAEADARHALTAGQLAHEPTLEQLVTPEDPDWASYQSDDPAWFLRAAGRVIRKYVGWHIFPNIQTVQDKIPVGSRGIIMLKSRHVTQVDSLKIQSTASAPPGAAAPAMQWVDPNDYVWHPSGYIERKGWAYYAGWYYASYFYGNDPYYLPVWNTGFAQVTYWHGYQTLPEDVKEVAFELAEQAMTIRTGNTKLLESPGGYRAQFSQNAGLSLNPEQMNRLANYRVGMVA